MQLGCSFANISPLSGLLTQLPRKVHCPNPRRGGRRQGGATAFSGDSSSASTIGDTGPGDGQYSPYTFSYPLNNNKIIQTDQ